VRAAGVIPFECTARRELAQACAHILSKRLSMLERTFLRTLRCTAFAVAFWCASRLASANGRFPAANQLVVDPGDAEHLLLRATYGLLSSHDGGRTFAWICEDVLGQMGESDPAVAILRGGRLAVAAGDHLMLSDARQTPP
jgi:hypothetical protein